MSNKRKIEELINNSNLEELGNRELAHNMSKLTAKEKIERLLDEKSFVEIEPLHNKGIVAGYGSINGRPVCIYSQDVISDNGALTLSNVNKIIKVFDIAVKVGCPIISLLEGLKINLEDNLDVLNGISRLIEKQVAVSGVVPQIAVLFDSVVGGMAYSVALNDFVYSIDAVQFSSTLEKAKKLNNSEYKTEKTTFSFNFVDEKSCFSHIRELIEHIPANNLADTEILEVDLNRVSNELNTITEREYNVRNIINYIVDEKFLEISTDLIENVVIGLARIGGRVVGIIANTDSGVLDVEAFNQVARFVRFCDSFCVPLITLVNTQGYNSKSSKEITNAGARLMYAYAEATVPKINVLIGNAFGSMYIAMGNIGKDITLAWPNANLGLLQSEAYVSISRDITNTITRAEKVEEYKTNNEELIKALEKGYIDDIIEPSVTRQRIISALELFINKRENRPVKKHGNLPM